MANYTAVVDDAANLMWAKYNSASWTSGEGRIGFYEDTRANRNDNYSRVCVAVFDGANIVLKGTQISQITLQFQTLSAGASTSNNRTITFRKPLFQGKDTNAKGLAYCGEEIGSLTGLGYESVITFVLNESRHAELFAKLKEYLEAGNTTLVMYNSGETEYQDMAWSENYTRIKSIQMSVDYDEIKYVNRWNGTEFERCEVWCRKNGEWVQCAPHIYKDGAWTQTG